ncbi:MAG: hypothetical protein CM15mP12_8200 [Gammaproteobacteria bacterium]|nr:MAG: hypothetical protein CM15mP12_8200 [Gammaproteobacteria bacterium]
MILTRSLVEMSHLFESLKLKKLTLLGLAGVGDSLLLPVQKKVETILLVTF